jgi:hypothetical protein
VYIMSNCVQNDRGEKRGIGFDCAGDNAENSIHDMRIGVYDRNEVPFQPQRDESDVQVLLL